MMTLVSSLYKTYYALPMVEGAPSSSRDHPQALNNVRCIRLGSVLSPAIYSPHTHKLKRAHIQYISNVMAFK
jgi:hypothetical protein